MVKSLISVIIPIYNAENTLKKTVDSILNQSIGFENIELILVDDCSSDNSRDIMVV
jgi:glycosyltransferase involved in cell wall biosynthesis